MYKKIDLNGLPEHFDENDAELFTDVADGFGEAEVSDEQLDRILTSAMGKAGYEMDNTIYEQGIIKLAKANEEKEDVIAVIPAAREEEKPEEVHAETTFVKRWGGLAACIAFIAVAAVSMTIMFARDRIDRSAASEAPGMSASETIVNAETETRPEAETEPETAMNFDDDMICGETSSIDEELMAVLSNDSFDLNDLKKLGYIEMPNVYYMSSEAAEASLKRQGLVPKKVESLQIPLPESDTVFCTDPWPNQYVKIGSEVEYYVCDMYNSRYEEIVMENKALTAKYKTVIAKFKEDTGVVFKLPEYDKEMSYDELTEVSDRYKYLISLDDTFEDYLYNTYLNSLVEIEVPVPDNISGKARIYVYRDGRRDSCIEVSEDMKGQTVTVSLRGDGVDKIALYVGDMGNFDIAGHEPYKTYSVNFISGKFTEG